MENYKSIIVYLFELFVNLFNFMHSSFHLSLTQRMIFFNRLFFFISVLFITNFCSAQIFPPKNYPVNYFSWPVRAVPGIVANFGELRPNHYHMGLDCRTDQHENVPVLAAADGYIAKVKIEPFGFGRCLYINHPNGLTTLYAHLNDFYPELENYITKKQYEMESWAVFLDVPSDLFPVTKGQFIAYSGNTGGSQGPHTHFEIRDTKTDKVLNPLLFGFPITDHIAPSVLRLAIYDRTKSTYQQSPRFVSIKKVKGVYQTIPAIILLPATKVSFAITAFDRYTGSTNQNGIYEADLYDNDQAVIGFQLDSISYDETRYLNAHIDYKLRNSGGPFVQHLSRLPGYPPGVYKEITGDGVIDISDNQIHLIKIEVKDVAGNMTEIQFSVKSSASPVLLPAQNIFKPGYINVFENENLHFYLGENELYDSIDFRVRQIAGTHAGSVAFQLQGGDVPVHTYYTINIKKTAAANPGRMVMRRWWGSKDDYAKAAPVTINNETGWYQSMFKALGNVELYEDNIPPAITPVGFRNGMNASRMSRLVFVIRDATDELQNFRAELDGKWLRFSNDKGKTFIYKFDEHCLPGEHELKLSVEDCAGNRTEKVYSFKR